jgi:hypothetical protein
MVLAMPASTSSASAKVSFAGRGSMVMVSNRPRSDGLICISRARPLGVVSPKTTRRPAVIAGTIWSSMVALWPWWRPLIATCTISGMYQIVLWVRASSSIT